MPKEKQKEKEIALPRQLNRWPAKQHMRILVAILFVVFFASSPAFAQSAGNKDSAPDTPDRKALNGFGGHLIVVEDPRGFIREWMKPETPKINPAKEVKRGDSIGAFVLFAGCKPDSHDICKSEVDYTVYRPDGTVFVERKSLPLWDLQAPPAPIIQLGKAILAFKLGPNDGDGVYRVKARVSDLNANVTLELETEFRLK